MHHVAVFEAEHLSVARRDERPLAKTQAQARRVAVVEIGGEERHVVHGLAVVFTIENEAGAEQRSTHPSVPFHKGLEAGVLEECEAQEVMCVRQLIADVELAQVVAVGIHDRSVEAADGLEAEVKTAVKQPLAVVLHVGERKSV